MSCRCSRQVSLPDEEEFWRSVILGFLPIIDDLGVSSRRVRSPGGGVMATKMTRDLHAEIAYLTRESDR